MNLILNIPYLNPSLENKMHWRDDLNLLNQRNALKYSSNELTFHIHLVHRLSVIVHSKNHQRHWKQLHTQYVSVRDPYLKPSNPNPTNMFRRTYLVLSTLHTIQASSSETLTASHSQLCLIVRQQQVSTCVEHAPYILLILNYDILFYHPRWHI